MDPLSAIRGLAAAHVARQRQRWASRGAGVHEAIDDILAGQVQASQEVTSAIGQAHAALAAEPRWRTLTGELDLGVADVEWLALLVACEVDPRLTRVLGYLDDSASPALPTPAAAAQLWAWTPGRQPGPGWPVATWQLAQPDGDWQATTPWRVDAEIAAYLAGDPDWTALRGEVRPAEVDFRDCLQPLLLAEMVAALEPVAGIGCVAELSGRPGSGRRTLLAQLALALGRRPLLLSPGTGVRGLRTARLLGGVPIVVADPGDPIGVDAARLTLVAARAPARDAGTGPRLSWEMPATTAEQRRTLWGQATHAEPPALVNDWELTPGELAAAAAAGPAAARVLRSRVRSESAALMMPMPLPYQWDDLVVAEHISDALQRLVSEVRLRHEVLDGWEFRRLCPTTAGVTALFAGPSGTGKTMASQVVARELGLDLYRIDLASVVSKYIGETEKQLARVFDEAERSDLMVLFDEADALFGQRTRVTDAHDRYANIEIDYLLQRLDSFTGVAVLATNRKSDLDAAFLRRLRTVVDFVAPAPSERLRLWRSALPSHTSSGEPVTEAVDHHWLATQLDLTGAEIKTIALSAAFQARQAGRLITLDALLEASRRELGKRGAVLRLPVGQRTEVAS